MSVKRVHRVSVWFVNLFMFLTTAFVSYGDRGRIPISLLRCTAKTISDLRTRVEGASTVYNAHSYDAAGSGEREAKNMLIRWLEYSCCFPCRSFKLKLTSPQEGALGVCGKTFVPIALF